MRSCSVLYPPLSAQARVHVRSEVMKLSILMPVYNEYATLAVAVKEVLAAFALWIFFIVMTIVIVVNAVAATSS